MGDHETRHDSPCHIYGLIYTNYSIPTAFLDCQFPIALHSDSDVKCSDILEIHRKFVM